MLLSLQHMQIGVAQPIQPEIAPGINCDWDFLVISWIPNPHNDDKGTQIFFGWRKNVQINSHVSVQGQEATMLAQSILQETKQNCYVAIWINIVTLEEKGAKKIVTSMFYYENCNIKRSIYFHGHLFTTVRK